MDSEELFINSRSVPELSIRLQPYTLVNGVLKKITLTPLTSKIINPKNIWYRFQDIPHEVQDQLLDLAINTEDIINRQQKKTNNKYRIYDRDQVQIYEDKNIFVLPIVGRVLPSDGTPAYTIITDNGIPKLKPILVCWNCHWSDLFAGHTKYGNNVFCLASDLSDAQREAFIDDIITIQDAQFYSNKSLIKRIFLYNLDAHENARSSAFLLN